MLGPHREDIPRHHVTAIVRDVVEIVAIIAAGIWAIYTFVYIERIKPSYDTPQVTMTGTLQREGERNGLVAFRYNVLFRNTGHVQLVTIATAFSAIGLRYASPGRRVSRQSSGVTTYERDAREVSRTPVYRVVSLGNLAGGRGGLYEIDPGNEIPESGIFFVRRADFDEVLLTASLAYAKYKRHYPTKVSVTPDGDVEFYSASNDPQYDYLQEIVDRTSLW